MYSSGCRPTESVADGVHVEGGHQQVVERPSVGTEETGSKFPDATGGIRTNSASIVTGWPVGSAAGHAYVEGGDERVRTSGWLRRGTGLG